MQPAQAWWAMLTALAVGMSATTASAQSPPRHPAALVGHYDGHQMEMGAELVLKADGSFQYGLEYGAIDEEAEGSWAQVGDHVVLTGKPVTAPRFVFLGQQSAPTGIFRLSLEAPDGMSLQYFEASIAFAKGGGTGGQLSDDGVNLPFKPDNPPVKVGLFLPMYEIKSDIVAIDPVKGYWLSFRFEQNDLGKVDFRDTPLAIDKGDLVFERFGRVIRFHRDGPQQ